MPSRIISIFPSGRINRRDKPDLVSSEDVLSRENCMVVGITSKRIKKHPGSSRYNATATGNSPITWGQRYYTSSNVRKNFFFGAGTLSYGDENGNITNLLSLFSPNAYPCSTQIRVSSRDLLIFSEGLTTGLYSYDGNNGNTFTRESSVTQNFVGLLVHLDRLWGFEDDSDTLRFSVNLNPFNFTDSTDAGSIIIGPKRGSKIQQIALLNETLYIFKTDSIWVLEGRTPSEFVVREVNPFMGLAARHSLQNVGSALIGLMTDYELYEFTGSSQLKLLSYNVALGGDLSKDLNPIINRDRMAQVKSTFHNFIYRMAFCETGETVNRMEYCYDTINQTDFFTRGNNVSCYLKYDRFPDKNELLTGRSDVGRLMKQYTGLNWDNEASPTSMPIKTQTSFLKLGEPRNIRIKRAWLNSSVLGAQNIGLRYYLDGRNSVADSVTDEFVVYGETKGLTNNLRIASQTHITSRVNLRHNTGKGQSISFEIDDNIQEGRDFEFSSIDLEIIEKALKRNRYVGI